MQLLECTLHTLATAFTTEACTVHTQLQLGLLLQPQIQALLQVITQLTRGTLAHYIPLPDPAVPLRQRWSGRSLGLSCARDVSGCI